MVRSDREWLGSFIDTCLDSLLYDLRCSSDGERWCGNETLTYSQIFTRINVFQFFSRKCLCYILDNYTTTTLAIFFLQISTNAPTNCHRVQNMRTAKTLLVLLSVNAKKDMQGQTPKWSATVSEGWSNIHSRVIRTQLQSNTGVFLITSQLPLSKDVTGTLLSESLFMCFRWPQHRWFKTIVTICDNSEHRL